MRRSHETMLWMRDKGVRFAPIWGRQAFKVDGRFKFWGGLTVETWGGGPGLVEALTEAARTQRHRRLVYEARAHRPVDRRRRRARRARPADTGSTGDVRAKAVVLAGGGFQANAEWRTPLPRPGLGARQGARHPLQHRRRHPHGARHRRGAVRATGPGCHAVGWERNAPEFGDLAVGDGFQKHSYPFGIMINADGKRFVDEGADFRNYTYAKYGRVILDQPRPVRLADLRSEGRCTCCATSTASSQVTKVTANTLEELVAQARRRERRARRSPTIRRYNAAVQTRRAVQPERQGRARHATGSP